ncbi:MAG: xanthine dehydrogenase family protein molybdopterin-binding subunit [Rhizobiaceae bacterium]|nr:xanthine dehydrogenase family protein molybdopterin-binding subunit [Rhizobiaceae bacterium]
MADSSSLIECSPHRVEDDRFITGQGRYVADLKFENLAHAVFLRAPVAHARITSINLDAVRESEGVIAAFTGLDLKQAGLRPMPCLRATNSADGTPFNAPERYPIAVDTVRHAGEAIAVVIAESEAQALDALDVAELEFDTLDVVVDAPSSRENAFDWEKGDRATTDEAFARAARIVRLEAVNNRVLISPIEPRGAVAVHDHELNAYTLYAPTQGVHLVRTLLAPTLGIEPSKLRVITNDVGGSFGAKLVSMPEQTALLFAAKACRRPVRWLATRSENQLTDIAGRDHVSTAELALDADHRIIGLRVETYANLGAYASALGPSPPTAGFAATLCGPYDFQAMHLTVRGRFTNTAPTDAYRGSGKPESVHLMERLIARAGIETGLGPIEFRRRNLIPARRLPYTAASGYIYDNADFASVMDKAVELAGWQDFESRRRTSESVGLRRGIGLGLYLHTSGVTSQELSRVKVNASGFVSIETGTQSSGQGHETSFAQLIAEKLGLKLNEVRVFQGDSLNAESGGPTAGSSSLQVGGVTILRAADAMLERAKDRAAAHLGVNVDSITYERGYLYAAGTNHSVSLFELTAALESRGEPGCQGEAALAGNILTIPNGAYVCEVVIDPDTGSIEIERFVAVDDVGRRLNPQIVEGQIHGAIAQGIGQALHERVIYDPESGQMLTGSLMDYGLPRADDLPMLEVYAADIPTTNNILGMKGAGEIGCIGAPAAVMNAVADAVGHDKIDMPLTPEGVWRALEFPELS